MTYQEWNKLRNVLTKLTDTVESKVCDVEVSKAFDDVWDLVDDKWVHDYYDERWQHYYDVLTKDIKDIGQVEAMCDRMAMEDVENLEMEG